MEISEIVENYTSSLVREYLYRKGLKSTLAMLDSEYPRNSLSINSSSVLIKTLGIENIMKINRNSRNPYNSILEVIVYHIKRGHVFNKGHLKVGKHNPPTLLALSNLKGLHKDLNENGENVDFLTLVKLYCGCCSKESIKGKQIYRKLNEEFSPIRRSNGIKRDENGEATIEFDEKFYYEQREPQAYFQKEVSTLTEKQNILKSYILGKNEESEDDLEVSECSQKICTNSSSAASNSASPTSQRTLNSDRSTSHSPKKEIKINKIISKDKTENTISTISLKVPTIQISDEADSQDNENNSFEVISMDEIVEKSQNALDTAPECSDEEFISSEIKQKNENCNINYVKTETYKKNVNSEVDKIDNNKLISNDCNNLSKEHQMKHLKRLLSANNTGVSRKWLGEGFIFDKSPTSSYGLIQTKEGSSGVLAAVNAYVIKELLFNETKNDVEFLRPQESQLEPALIEAMTQILWQAGEDKATVAVLETEPKEIRTIEDIINNTSLKILTSKNEVQSTLKNNISFYVTPECHGCVLFLISAVLSRGIQNVIEDMNGVTSLITSNGYSTLELVNLLLSGIAVSNVFDNHIKLQFSIIRGIPKRSVIGYLSIKEHFKYCKVGSYLKTPRFPIWIVHNENQFTILFSCTKQLLSDWKVERKFIMTYYDPLKCLGDETRLTVDTTLANGPNNERDNVKTIVENCVRTKWKDANITWK